MIKRFQKLLTPNLINPFGKKPVRFSCLSNHDKHIIEDAHKLGRVEYFGKSTRKWYPKRITSKLRSRGIYRTNTRPINPKCPKCDGQLISTKYGYCCVDQKKQGCRWLHIIKED